MVTRIVPKNALLTHSGLWELLLLWHMARMEIFFLCLYAKQHYNSCLQIQACHPSRKHLDTVITDDKPALKCILSAEQAWYEATSWRKHFLSQIWNQGPSDWNPPLNNDGWYQALVYSLIRKGHACSFYLSILQGNRTKSTMEHFHRTSFLLLQKALPWPLQQGLGVKRPRFKSWLWR